MLNLQTNETIYNLVCTRNYLTARIKTHQMTQMDRIVHQNLTTNEPYCKTLHYEIKPLSASTLKEKCYLLYLHAKENPWLYKDVIKSIVLMTGVIAITIIGARLLGSHIATSTYFKKLYDDIINHRLIYVRSGRLVGLERYNEEVFQIWLGYFSITTLAGLGTIRYSYNTLTYLIESLLKFLNDSNELTCQEQLKDSSYPLNDGDELANSSDEFFVQDPILMSDIKKDWMHAPRFIKIGKTLYSLNTALQFLFQKPLENGSIKSLTGNWSLTTEDQEKLITDLSQLFMIKKEYIIKYWDPYFCDWDKLSCKDPRLENASEDEKNQIFQEIFLERDLSRMFPNWVDLNQQERASAKQQIRNDLFANLRLLNFLKEFDESVLETSIKLNDDDSFTLKDLQTELKEKNYQIRL